MKKKDYRISDYLSHIVQCIQNIENHTKNLTEEEFLNNQLVKDAVLYNFAIMGEASNNIKVVDATFLEQYTYLKKVLSLAYRMRNVVIHAYLDVDYLLIWDTIKYKLPELKSLLAKVEKISVSCSS